MVCEVKHSAVITEGIVCWDPVFFLENTVPKRNIRGFSMTLVEGRIRPFKRHVKVILVPSASYDSMGY